MSDLHEPVCAALGGRIAALDNRRIAAVAKLAGAPIDPGAGVRLHTHVGAMVDEGQPLFTVYADSPGELEYALEFARSNRDMVTIGGQ